MFDLSFSEMAVIAVLILVCFDVDQLPGLMRQAGRMYAKVRAASDDLRRVFNAEVARAESDQRRVDLEKRREELARQREARRPAPAAVPSRPPPEDAVTRSRGPEPVATQVATEAPAAPAPAAAEPAAAEPAAAGSAPGSHAGEPLAVETGPVRPRAVEPSPVASDPAAPWAAPAGSAAPLASADATPPAPAGTPPGGDDDSGGEP